MRAAKRAEAPRPATVTTYILPLQASAHGYNSILPLACPPQKTKKTHTHTHTPCLSSSSILFVLSFSSCSLGVARPRTLVLAYSMRCSEFARRSGSWVLVNGSYHAIAFRSMIRTDYRASSYAINITTASFKNQTVSALTPTPTVTIAASKNMMSGQSTA